MLAESATMNLHTTSFFLSTTQSIVFQDTSVSVNFRDLDKNNIYTLYGIRSGMKFLTSPSLIVSVSYDSSTGYLTVLNAGATKHMVFDIGTAYDPSGLQFRISKSHIWVPILL